MRRTRRPIWIHGAASTTWPELLLSFKKIKEITDELSIRYAEIVFRRRA
jgi:hypothetical protein